MGTAAMEEIIELIGPEAVRQIVQQWGGTNLYISKDVKPRDPVALTIGFENAELLAQYYGGGNIALPVRENHLSDRNKGLLADLHDGDTLREVALRYGLSIRQIQNIKRAAGK